MRVARVAAVATVRTDTLVRADRSSVAGRLATGGGPGGDEPSCVSTRAALRGSRPRCRRHTRDRCRRATRRSGHSRDTRGVSSASRLGCRPRSARAGSSRICSPVIVRDKSTSSRAKSRTVGRLQSHRRGATAGVRTRPVAADGPETETRDGAPLQTGRRPAAGTTRLGRSGGDASTRAVAAGSAEQQVNCLLRREGSESASVPASHHGLWSWSSRTSAPSASSDVLRESTPSPVV